MTHVAFNPDSVDWMPFLARQQEGRGEMQYFVGTPYQRGGGLLNNIARFLMPVASNVLKSVSREGLTAGNRVFEDLAQGKTLRDSIQTQAKQGMDNLAEKLKQCGKGTAGKKINRRPKQLAGRNNDLTSVTPVRRTKRQIIDQLTFSP